MVNKKSLAISLKNEVVSCTFTSNYRVIDFSCVRGLLQAFSWEYSF